MERDFAAYLFTLFCPLFTSGDSFSIALAFAQGRRAVCHQQLSLFSFLVFLPSSSVSRRLIFLPLIVFSFSLWTAAPTCLRPRTSRRCERVAQRSNEWEKFFSHRLYARPTVLHDLSVLVICGTMQINSRPTENIIYFWKQKVAICIGDMSWINRCASAVVKKVRGGQVGGAQPPPAAPIWAPAIVTPWLNL